MKDTAKSQLLILRAQCGDESAMSQLLTYLEQPLLSFLRRVIGRHDLAQDVLQEVMLTVARKLGQLNDPQAIRPWVFALLVGRRIER